MKKAIKKKMKMRKYSGPFGFNTPATNIFKSGRETSPVVLFNDYDKDHVPNVFDCQPLDPNRQGILAAIAGAVKGAFSGGGIRAGWRAGMAKPSFSERMEFKDSKRREEFGFKQDKEVIRNYEKKVKEQKELERQYKENQKAKLKTPLYRAVNYATRPIKQVASPYKPVSKQQIQALSKKLEEGEITKEEFLKKMKQPKSRSGAAMLAKKFAQEVLPRGAIPQKAYSPRVKSKEEKLKEMLGRYMKGRGGASVSSRGGYYRPGGTGGPGRPRGTYDARYARFGGVFGYRKWLAQQRSAEKETIKRMLEQKRLAAQPSYERTPYREPAPQQQMPQEMEMEMEYEPQVQQVQQMPQQMPQQYPVQQIPIQQVDHSGQRPIGRIFKSYGGSPYPPVERRPLAPTAQTIPAGYIEVVDAFTGQRKLKQLPPTERWAGGQR